MKRKDKIIVIGIIIITIVVVGYLTLYSFNKKLNIVYDYKLIHIICSALMETNNQVKQISDSECIDELNELLDGKEHYLHDIDENTKFGTMLLSNLSTRAFETDDSQAKSFFEFENKIRTVNNNKSFVIKYNSDGYVTVEIPNSNESLLPLIKGNKLSRKVYLK